MWSHYADQHRGLVFGFDSAVIEESLKRPIEQVEYVEDLPAIIDYKPHIQSSVFGVPVAPDTQLGRRWALVKHKDWAYEREWRMILGKEKGSLGVYDDTPFPRESLKEIILGCRLDYAAARELIALGIGMSPNTAIFQMHRHESKLGLVKDPVPW